MAETTKDIWNDNDGVEPPKKHRLRGVLLFFLTLLAVLGVVLAAAYRDGTGFDVLRRRVLYGSAKSSGEGFDYDASSSNRFVNLDGSLVVLSDTALTVLGEDGVAVWSTPVKMTAPALAKGGGRAVAYDVGGTELYVVDAAGLQLSLTADKEEPFIAASLNHSGWLAVTAEKKNYKGCVSVYDEKMQLAFAFHSSRRFVTDAYVTDDGKRLAAVTLGQESSVFVSNVVLYDLTQTDPVADYDVQDGLVLAVGQQDGQLLTVSDTRLTLAGTDGTVASEYSYGGAYLREYDFSGEECTVLLLNRYQSGSVGRLVTVDTKGQERASLDVNEEILSISAAKRYIAVLYTDSLVIYNQDLEVYATLKGTGYAKEALMRDDGSVLLIAAESARLFLP